MKLGLAAGVLLLFLLSGCSIKDWGNRPAGHMNIASREEAIRACKELCRSWLDNGADLSNGPCLSMDNPDWNVPGWVCDVAHSPRREIDNLKENQCPEYGITVSRFVELSPYCTLINVQG